MTPDQKVRIGLALATVAVPALTALALAHGIHVRPLDQIGGDGP